jgi:hypothetical protein
MPATMAPMKNKDAHTAAILSREAQSSFETTLIQYLPV